MPTLRQGLDVQLILHIGMHKTASTTIQKRLKVNNQLLQSYGYLYIAKERKTLLKGVLQKDFKPWRQLIRNARKTASTPIVSHEAFSHVLCRGSSASNASCLGDWLLKKLSQAGVNVMVIGFVRDQPSYLNSHYTQHVKRFATTKSLEAYAAKAMRRSIHRSSCDPEQLFGWLMHHASVRTVFFPYGRSIAQPAAQHRHPTEPFAQLIHCLKIPDSAHFQRIDDVNAQPGDLAIRTALQLRLELKRDGIRLDKTAKQRARALLCKEAERRNWAQTPYMGLNPELNRRIRDHFSAANNRFAQRVWGCQWDEIFTPGASAEARFPIDTEKDDIDQAIRRIRRKLFQSRPLRDAIRNVMAASRFFQ